MVKIPSLGDSITTGVVQSFVKKEGDFVNVDDVLAVLETEKTTVEIRADKSGQIVKLLSGENQEIAVGANLVEIDTSKVGSPSAAPTEPKKADSRQTTIEPPKQGSSAESPKAPEPKQGSAQTSAPAQQAKTQEQPKLQTPLKVEKPASTDSPSARSEKVVPMNRLRQTIAKRLKQSQNDYATLTTFNECDMSEAMNIRKKYQDEFVKRYGIKLGFMSFFLKASTIALQEIPIVNSVIANDTIVHRNFIDISVAVAAPHGLLVPVIKNCEKRSFADFETTLADLGKRARENKIALEEMQGGTFTVSNGGVYGSMLGTPIINPPQSAILGMHNIVNRPVVRGNEMVARPIMYLALSYDHRLIDGREAVLFLKRVKDLIEDPYKMLINI